ncbi:hypothetical protein ACF0H5_020187 [Mactra antiquata]
MNNKQKELLVQHKTFLVKNIPWTDDLVNKLLAHGVITDTMLKDIQNDALGKHKTKPMLKLLEILPLRGGGVYRRFCEVLLLNGHPFIADFLLDEENVENSTIDHKELYKRLPILEKHLKDQDRRRLEEYVVEKAKESRLKGTWSKEAIAREKDKAIDARQKQLDDAFEYEEKEKQLTNEIAGLKKSLSVAQNETVELKSQLGFMGSKLKETEEKFRSDFGVQMRYNNANENAMKRLQETSEKFDTCLQHVDSGIKSVMHVPARNSEREQMAQMEFKYAFVEEDFKKLIEKYKKLLEVEKQNEQLLHEKNYILSHLGHSDTINENPSLLNAYRDFAVKTDEDILTLKSELQKHNNIIEGQQEKIQHLNKEVESHTTQKKMKNAGTVWQNAMMTVMRKQLNDVKHENRIKDTRIQHFENEVNKLKAKVAELEAEKGSEQIIPLPKHSHRDILSPSSERYQFTPASYSTDHDSDADKSKSPKSKRYNQLPPLGGRILYQAPDNRGVPHLQHAQRNNQRPQANQRNTWNPSGSMPAGLVTHQLKIENRGYGIPEHKLGNMRHGLGGLKAMHGKHVRS